MTSCSGGSIATLEKSKRVVITATKSGTERNAPVFARFWIEALRDPAADADKNEVITALEAFRYAEAKTVKYYEESKRLATEHPLLEDAGKGEGVRTPSVENGEGQTAGRFAVLHTGSAVALANNPEKQKLLKAKEDIEQKIDDLKYRKASLSVEDYRKQLAEFLVELGLSKARALMQRRYHVSYEDVRALMRPILRHRVLLNFQAESDKLTTDDILIKLLEAMPAPKE